MTTDVVIIGGGVSGLTTARQLASRGLSVQVLERQVRPGGNAVSERVGGFLMEHGPSTVNAAMPEALGLQQELGLDGDRSELGGGVKYRYLQAEGRLHQISVHALGFLTSNYLSPAARLRVLWEAFVPARKAPDDETVADYWSRRFGRRFAERVIDPLIGGLFAARAEDLSMASVFPKLLEMERLHGSVIRGVVKARLKGGKMPGRSLYSWREGIGSLPRALAADLGTLVRTGVTVRGIKRAMGEYVIDAGDKGLIRARSVVLATQAHVSADLLSALDDEAACAASEICSPGLAVVYFGYRRDQVAHPLDGLGYLTPAAEGRSVSGALFASTMFDGRAPEGHVALSAYLGGSRAPQLADLSEADLMAEVQAEYADVLGVRGDPVISRVRRWPLGIPQAGLGHAGRVERLRGLALRSPGLHVTGNYLSGPSVAACVAEALATAERVADELAAADTMTTAPILKSAAALK